jgi:hypothetical protein
LQASSDTLTWREHGTLNTFNLYISFFGIRWIVSSRFVRTVGVESDTQGDFHSIAINIRAVVCRMSYHIHERGDVCVCVRKGVLTTAVERSDTLRGIRVGAWCCCCVFIQSEQTRLETALQQGRTCMFVSRHSVIASVR